MSLAEQVQASNLSPSVVVTLTNLVLVELLKEDLTREELVQRTGFYSGTVNQALCELSERGLVKASKGVWTARE